MALVATGLASTLASCGTVVVPAGPRAGSPAESPATTAVAVPVAPGAAPSARPSRPATVAEGDWGIGDSVMLGSRTLLAAAGVRVDAVVGRQFGQAVSRVRAASRAGSLPRNVLVHLGTNGVVTVSDCRAVVDAAGPARRVFLVTVAAPRTWTTTDNVHLRACAASYPGRRVVLVDWAARSSHHPEWFYGDHIHPDPAGRLAYTSLIRQTLTSLGI